MIGKTAWPANVLFRFLTIGGATVDIAPQPTTALPDRYAAVCGGCEASYTNPTGMSHNVKSWAQAHSETCRALPRPTT
ncbi:hypothetical protein [Streptomyces sp. V1I1]|uniref:hypothetical protein n=1 Tax=Streptomyces sp. V1I1 TaxID=3042272 RepID=UPI0027853D52|nr:hypothetical protein [Streptomyces sp. V1I1]MDQ0941722.1 hypothetical protein [Streptomyces sp. V1I1]